MSWVASREVDPPELVAVTIRAGITTPDINWTYGNLQIRSEDLTPQDAAARVEAGRVTYAPGPPTLERQQGCSVYWYTTGVDSKMTAPLEGPSYYFTCGLASRERVQNFRSTEPLFGPGLPFFPRASDAILETLYGVTRDQGRREMMFELLLELPYTGASIQALGYDDSEGLVVTIGEGLPGSARGHSLHVTWKLDQNDRVLSRATLPVETAGGLIVAIDAPPYYLSLGLVDSDGLLVDTADAYRETEVGLDESEPLPPQALAEALDHLDSVWRNAFGDWLFNHPQLTGVAGLGLAVSSRADFESRLSYLADILKAVRVPDALLDSKSREGLAQDASLARLKVALSRGLSTDDAEGALQALEVLSNTNRLRVALQHTKADDLPTAMARLDLRWPGDWNENWERLRHRVVRALGDVRRGVATQIKPKAN